MWQGWLNVCAGAWLILCGFIPALRSPVSMFAAGAVILVDGILGSIENRSWQSGLNAAAVPGYS
jgi:hypothetical protein